MGRGGQVSIEFLIVTGFSLLLLIPIILLFGTQSSAIRTELVEAQAQEAGQALVNSAERVYYAGPPSQEVVRVTFPDYVQSIQIRNSSVIITIQGDSQYDMVVPSSVPLIETTLPSGQGVARIQVRATVGGVLFTEQ